MNFMCIVAIVLGLMFHEIHQGGNFSNVNAYSLLTDTSVDVLITDCIDIGNLNTCSHQLSDNRVVDGEGFSHSKKSSSEKVMWLKFISALFAEIPSMIISYPLSRMCTMNQINFNGKDIGFGAQYRGMFYMLLANQLSKIFYWSIYYPCFHFIEVSNSSSLMIGLSAFSASIIAGMLSVIITNPIWVLMTNFQVYGKLEMPQNSSQLFNGLGMSILLVSFPSIRQFVYEFLVNQIWISRIISIKLIPLFQISISKSCIHGVIGAIATGIATIITYPVQTLRTRSQVNTAELSKQNCFEGLSFKMASCVLQGFTFFLVRDAVDGILKIDTLAYN